MHTIPKEAKCEFIGKIYKLYQWEQELFDGSKKIFEALTRPNGVIIIPVLQSGEIIYLEQRQPNTNIFYSFPGGNVEDGESYLKAGKRELKEETGLNCENLKPWYIFQPNGKVHFKIHIFIAQNAYFESSQKLDSGEKITIRKTGFDDLINLMIEKSFIETDILLKLLLAERNELISDIKKLFYN
jgi:ADP-ribose pyrophosphatase